MNDIHVVASLHQCEPRYMLPSLSSSESTSETASCITYGRVPILYNGPPPFPLKIVPSHGASGPPSNTWFLWPPKSTPQMASWSVSRFCRAHDWEFLYLFAMGRPLSSSKLPLPVLVSAPHLIHRSLVYPESASQTVSRSIQPFLQGLWLWHIKRQTDRPHYSIGNSRPYLCGTALGALWPKN